MQSVTRYVLSLGMYLSAYPKSLTQGVPAWMKNKHPKDQGRGVDAVSYSRHDAALQAAMTSPRTVAPHWRQLRHSRYYQKQFSHRAPGSRYVLVSGYDVGNDVTVGVESGNG